MANRANRSASKTETTIDFNLKPNVRVPQTNKDGEYLGKSVKVVSHSIRIPFDDLPEEVQKLFPADMEGEEARGNVNIFVPIPEDMRNVAYRYQKS